MNSYIYEVIVTNDYSKVDAWDTAPGCWHELPYRCEVERNYFSCYSYALEYAMKFEIPRFRFYTNRVLLSNADIVFGENEGKFWGSYKIYGIDKCIHLEKTIKNTIIYKSRLELNGDHQKSLDTYYIAQLDSTHKEENTYRNFENTEFILDERMDELNSIGKFDYSLWCSHNNKLTKVDVKDYNIPLYGKKQEGDYFVYANTKFGAWRKVRKLKRILKNDK